ncbi:Hypothetical protein MAU_2020 [Metamycoplasma auris 15026]|uniref:Uncharacterized protein n=1 Tax=Metamycoplasma auris 15026 TaxID=1188233 RepID=N9TSW5_9BACT|nr:hypothetical protein [Metamycoplasma auris]ENY69160.1 Hypothetical protein MAU_2020 [Metamycoplasma auris 15026]
MFNPKKDWTIEFAYQWNSILIFKQLFNYFFMSSFHIKLDIDKYLINLIFVFFKKLLAINLKIK